MSLIPVAPFLDFARNDRKRIFHARVKENPLLGACFMSKFQSWIQTKQRKIFRTRLTSTFCTDRLGLSMCRNCSYRRLNALKAVKIISGGQTGVDRAALDAALRHGIKSGGWCPTGRLDEFGRIPDRYAVKELENGGSTERTLQNVKDSNGTVIIYPGKLSGGTEQTLHFCVEQRRPHELIDASNVSTEKAAQLIADFVRETKIDILNVAGPRASEWPEGYDYAFRVLDIFLATNHS